MPTNLENLLEAKANLTAKLASITANPQPTYNIDGQQVAWSEFYDTLTEQLLKLNQLIATEGPYELKSSMY